MSEMWERFQCRLSVKVDDQTRGPWAAPQHESLTLGRVPHAGLHLGDDWVPSRLGRLVPFDRGWVLQLGRSRATVVNKYVGQHVFRGRAMVALQPGRSLVHFLDLDRELKLAVTIGADVAEGLEELHNAPEREPARNPETVYAGHDVELTDHQRAVVAVAYRHLIERTPKPVNVTKHAAQVLGKSEQSVKNTLTDVRRKVNRERWLDLRDTEHLGYYLTRVTRVITLADLPDHLR
ncbi:hypothetical protein IEQ44_07560 [Nocardioides sp. Y6]|uniref:Uncharacterized protein n=1 Tax=Nocardioides malaquae TaxID=2773426 RepID=A0ABR9RSF5_9ACTN|nr:hypothetical protein [Nocardioides malaquae]MBE7324506.1 hypothetical protein [Nocardioides malaquae]